MADMAVFGVIFMPTSIINLVAGSWIRLILRNVLYLGDGRLAHEDPEAGSPDHRARRCWLGGAWFLGDSGVALCIPICGSTVFFQVPAGTGFDFSAV